MVTKQIVEISHCMTQTEMDAFIQDETEKGTSKNAIRRFKCVLKVIYDYLPEDKCITKERLLAWRKSMEESGYSSATIEGYVKGINRYLDYVGCPEIRFTRGRAKDIAGITFGYLTAVRPTGAKNRGDIVWLCTCKCGNTVELPATRLLRGNTLSCGCLKGEHLKKVNKTIGNTNLRQALDDQVISTNAVSGYVGVTPKRGKWLAYIKYKGAYYSLGCYSDIQDAVKARARAKELVIEDAMELLDFYEEIHKDDPLPPAQEPLPEVPLQKLAQKINDTPCSAAKRSDNTSGHVGINFRNNRWESRICYQGVRYMLGRFKEIETAVHARKKAEELLKSEPEKFVEKYSRNHIKVNEQRYL